MYPEAVLPSSNESSTGLYPELDARRKAMKLIPRSRNLAMELIVARLDFEPSLSYSLETALTLILTLMVFTNCP
jgi:hypothetical protein